MCEYCEHGYVSGLGYESKPILELNDKQFVIDAEQGELVITNGSGFYARRTGSTAINYCPMCGKKLQQEVES